jgi:hypothetical protein
MSVFYLMQHAEKERQPGDPGLTELGRAPATSYGVETLGHTLAEKPAMGQWGRQR